jgi:hypothetical protein
MKPLDRVSDVMRAKHYSHRTERSYISWNKLPDREPDGMYGVWESRAALFSFSHLNAQGLFPDFDHCAFVFPAKALNQSHLIGVHSGGGHG